MAAVWSLWLVAVAAFLARAAAQCPADPLPAGMHTLEITSDGLVREFLVYVPRSYNNTATPVFVNFHGYLGLMNGFNALSGVDIVSEEQGFIGVIPQGYLTSWNGGECCGAAARDELDDVAFTRRMIAYVQTRVCVDPSLIFAGGFSNGNFFTYRLACTASDLFRAIGGNAGELSGETSFTCLNQTRNVPFIHFHGTADAVIRYRNGQSSFQRYISPEISNCVDQPTVTYQNGSATCETWDSCDQGIQATFCTIEGQGHEWPGRAVIVTGCFDGCTGATQDINATREMWNFFRRVAGF